MRGVEEYRAGGRSARRPSLRSARCLAGRAILLILVGSSPIVAQEEATTRLSVEDAVGRAFRTNPTVRRAVNELDRNPADRRLALFTQVLPNVTGNIFSTGYEGNISSFGRDDFGNPTRLDNAAWEYFSNTNQVLRVDWNIQGASLFNAYRQQQATAQTRRAAVTTAEWTLDGEVRTNYYDAVEQLALLEVEEALVAGREVDLESAERRFGIGQASRVDVLNARVQLGQQRIAVRGARSTYEQALLTLRTSIGDQNMGEVRVGSSDLPVFDPSTLDADQLIRRAWTVNPQLVERGVAVDGARLGVRRAAESWWPDLGFSYTLGRSNQVPDFDALFDLSHQSEELISTFQIQVTLPYLTNFFQDRADEAEAQVLLANAEEDQREQLLEIEQTIRSELINLRNQWESLEFAEESEEIAREATELARQEYQIGTRTFEDLQDVVDQEAEAVRTTIQARFAFIDALLLLEGAVGTRVRPAGFAGGSD